MKHASFRKQQVGRVKLASFTLVLFQELFLLTRHIGSRNRAMYDEHFVIHEKRLLILLARD